MIRILIRPLPGRAEVSQDIWHPPISIQRTSWSAHSYYFSKDAYADMIKDSKYADNKELMIIPGAVHTDLYDGGGKVAIPFDKLESFFAEYLK